MIRIFGENDLDSIIRIWLETNIQAHNFITKEYWIDNYELVKNMLPQADIYIYEDDTTNQIEGFVGLTDNYIAGIFIKEASQSKGIGKQLLNYVKGIKTVLRLSVYQKNVRAVSFYQREQFVIQSENIDAATGEKEFVMVWKR